MKESVIEEVLSKYPGLIEEGLERIGKEVAINDSKIDLLFLDKNKRYLIIEIKGVPVSFDIFDQVIKYKFLLSKEKGLDPSSIRCTVLSPEMREEAKEACRFYNIEYKRILCTDDLKQIPHSRLKRPLNRTVIPILTKYARSIYYLTTENSKILVLMPVAEKIPEIKRIRDELPKLKEEYGIDVKIEPITPKEIGVVELKEAGRKSLSAREARILSDLSYRGKGIFTLEDIKEYDKKPKKLLYNLSKKNWILKIKKGLYMIVPLEAGELGARSYTVHSFVIASHLIDPSYISHWSALNYHGLTEQTPPAVYITTTKPRNRKNILDIEFVFVTVHERKMFGTTEVKVENSPVKISTPEKTMVDCLDHPEHCGGIEEVAKAIYFEHKNLDFKKIVDMMRKMGNRTIIKRLGYLLERLGLHEYDNLLTGLKISKGYSCLDPKLPKKGKINERWKLRVNIKIDPEQWAR